MRILGVLLRWLISWIGWVLSLSLRLHCMLLLQSYHLRVIYRIGSLEHLSLDHSSFHHFLLLHLRSHAGKSWNLELRAHILRGVGLPDLVSVQWVVVVAWLFPEGLIISHSLSTPACLFLVPRSLTLFTFAV